MSLQASFRDRWTYWRPHLLYAFIVLMATALATLRFAAWLGKPLQCLHGCGQPSGHYGWLMGTLPDQLPRIQFQILSGDTGPLGRRLYPLLWYIPLLAPAMFLMLVVDCYYTPSHLAKRGKRLLSIDTRTASIELDSWHVTHHRRPYERPILFLAFGALYFLAARLALASGDWFAAGITILLTTAALAILRRMVSRRLDRTSHSSESEPERHGATDGWLFLVALAVACFVEWTAVVFVRDTLEMKRALSTVVSGSIDTDSDPSSGGSPRLFKTVVQMKSEKPVTMDTAAWQKKQDEWYQQVALLLKTLSGHDVLSDGGLRQVRRAMSILTADQPNIVAQNCCRGGWYIAALVVCVAFSALGITNGGVWTRLFIVLASFISVGLAFGVLYYDYYLLEAARYHALLETVFVPDPEALKQILPHGDKIDELVGSFQRTAYRNHRLILALQSGFFASSVFAQDSPQVAIESDAPDEFRPVAAGTLQFDLKSTTIEPAFPLAKRYKNASEGDTLPGAVSPPWTAQCAEAVLVQFRTRAFGSAKRSMRRHSKELSNEGPTNEASVKRIAERICSEAAQPTLKTDRGYNIKISSSADCQGSDDANDRLSNDRAAAVISRMRGLTDAVDSFLANHVSHDALESARQHTGDLRRALAHPDLQRYAQRRLISSDRCNDEFVHDLWPNSDFEDAATPTVNPGRAARIEITQRSANVDERVHMANGLTPNSTLSDMVYFSFVTITTTGYGDMKAVSGPVRFCVVMENILEILFTAIFFAAAMAVVTRE